MSKKNVTTIKGEELPISKTKKFPNGYYKIGDINVENSGDCYKINDKFYRFETQQVIFNHSTKQHQLITNDVVFGLLDNNIFGYFNKNEVNRIPIILENKNRSFAINEEVLKNNLNYREEISTGNYLHISLLNAKDFNVILPPKNEYKTSLPYDSKGITKKHSDIYNHLYDSKINKYSNSLGVFLKDLTFGLEFETTAGFIPERITKKLGLIPLRDGSISGLEYVTVPFSGPKGVQTIVDVCKELENRTEFNNSCALHLHIGGIPRTPEFILAFLKLSSWLQDDIFSLFPLYKKYNMGIKNKNYSKPYNLFEIFSRLDPVINDSNINKNFDVLFSFLTSEKQSFIGDFNSDLKNVEFHPADPQSNQKWNIKNRYFLHNFIPLIFGNKQTIEFRIHTPTFDYFRVLMFLLFNSMLIKFTEKYQKIILQDPNFFKKIKSQGDSRYNLFNFLYFFRGDEKISEDVNYMINSLIQYFDIRRQRCEQLTRNGEIEFEEKKIKYSPTVNFDTNRVITCKNTPINLDLEIPQLINEEIYLPPQVESKKKIYNTTLRPGLIEQMKKASINQASINHPVVLKYFDDDYDGFLWSIQGTDKVKKK